MKKIFMSLAVALVSLCASAQVYVGGTMGISSNKIGDGDSKVAYKFLPEIGYQFNKQWSVGLEFGLQKGNPCTISAVGDQTTYEVAPYVRYNFVNSKLFDVFMEGTVGYGRVNKVNADIFEIGIKPGVALNLSDKFSLITKVGFLGYRGYSPEHGKSSSTFGLDLDGTNIQFGAIVKF